MSQFDLTNKIALITGARRGIGQAIALTFAGAGADVAVGDRIIDDGELEGVAGQIKAAGRQSLALAADIRVPEQVENLVRQTVDRFGRLDILVNNAGAAFTSPAQEITPNGWNTIVNINLGGTFLCCQAAGRVMMAQKHGRIINIASIAGVTGTPGIAHYGAAKAGVINLTQSLAMEWAQYNINVNAIAPGSIESESADAVGRVPGAFDRQENEVPLKRRGQPGDIANAAIFLASEASRYITGEVIIVRGAQYRAVQ